MLRKKNILIASDHAGFELKEILKEYLESKKYSVYDCGPENGEDAVDYPDYAHKLCGFIKLNKAKSGILICGTGIGMSISANKHKSIRAALCTNIEMSEMSRKHNNANVLVLGARITKPDMAKKILDAFLDGHFEKGRHQKRIDKI
jgi:RpiB/LacA/LacB family sugar-phosphate isomerase